MALGLGLVALWAAPAAAAADPASHVDVFAGTQAALWAESEGRGFDAVRGAPR